MYILMAAPAADFMVAQASGEAGGFLLTPYLLAGIFLIFSLVLCAVFWSYRDVKHRHNYYESMEEKVPVLVEQYKSLYDKRDE